MNYYHRGNGFLISYLFPCIIIILDFYGTATRNLSHELEVFLQAKKFGKVDETVLQKDGIIVK